MELFNPDESWTPVEDDEDNGAPASVAMLRMALRPDAREAEMLSEENLSELRRNLAHLSLPAVRNYYEEAYRDCRLIYDRLPTPKQVQTLVQVWK